MPGNKRRGQGYKRINQLRRKIRESGERSDKLNQTLKLKKDNLGIRKKLIDNLEDQKDLNEFKRKGLKTILS